MKIFEVSFYYDKNKMGYDAISSVIINFESKEKLEKLITENESLFIYLCDRSDCQKSAGFHGFNVDDHNGIRVLEIGETSSHNYWEYHIHAINANYA